MVVVMTYKSKRSKACDIPQAVKDKVWERDGMRCIVCKNRQAMPNAHYIPRSKGGVGIEENIVTLCQRCHNEFDQTSKRPLYEEYIRKYLQKKYGPSWHKDKLCYVKFNFKL